MSGYVNEILRSAPVNAYKYILSVGGEIVMQEFIDLITNLGFPIFVSVYLMAELSTKMGNLDKSIQKLSSEIALLKEVLRNELATDSEE